MELLVKTICSQSTAEKMEKWDRHVCESGADRYEIESGKDTFYANQFDYMVSPI